MRSRPPPSLGLFVGRERELSRLAALGGERLVSVRGAVGIGKTRLVQEHLARSLRPHVFVELADERTSAGLDSATWRALGVSEGAARGESLATLLSAASERVLVLDSFEHLGESGAARVSDWLSAAPDLSVLVASRAELGVPGEVVVEVGPLSLADEGDALSSESARLLLDRAQRARADYQPTGRELERVRAIVDALEGVPLAIEIVAPRLARFGGEVIEARLAERLEWRARGGGTIADALAASWALLPPSEQEALGRASVFHGGFDLEAYEAVVGEGPLATLDALVAKSLVHVSDLGSASPGGRFALLRSVRDWVAQRVPSDARREHERLHAAYFGRRGKAMARELRGPDALLARRWFSRERENLSVAAVRPGASSTDAAACLLALEATVLTEGPLAPYERALAGFSAREGLEASVAIELLVARAQVLQKLGRVEEAAEVAREASEAARTSFPSLEPSARYALGCAQLAQGALAASLETFASGIAAAAREKDPLFSAFSSASMGAALSGLGRGVEARAYVERARETYAELGDLREEAMASAFLGNLCIDEGKLEEGELHLASAMASLSELGDRFGEAFVSANLAMLHHRGGQLTRAIDEYDDALEGFLKVGTRRYVGAFEGYRAVARLELGATDEARAGLLAASIHLRAAGDARFEAFFEAMHAVLELRAGELVRAHKRLEGARALHQPTRDAMIERALSVVGARLRSDEAKEAERRGEKERAAQLVRERDALRVLSALPDGEGRAPEQASFEVFLASRLAGEARETSHAAKVDELTVAVDGAFLAMAGGSPVRLEHRPSLMHMLAALVEARRLHPGRPLSRDALQRAGWPGEWIRASAAANRVRVGLATLRRLGLKDVLLTEPTGWLLDPVATLRVIDARSGQSARA